MFNQRKHRRRKSAAFPGQRSPRFRRLAIEAMESRLLLTGNQFTGGDLDDAIYNLDSFGNQYVIISQDETPSVTATTNNSNPRSHQLVAGGSAADYLSIYDQFAITPSLDVPLVLSNNTPLVITTILGNGDTNSTVEFNSTGKISNLGNLAGAGDISFFQTNSFYDSTLNANSFELQLGIGTKLDALNTTASAHGRGASLSQIGSPAVRLIVVQSVDSAGIGNHSFTAEFVAVTPSGDSQSIDSNVAALNVEPPLESNAGSRVDGNPVDAVQVDVVAPGRELAAILPARQPIKEEQLADAIDDLLSDDSIIVSPSGQFGSEFVVDGTPAGANDIASTASGEAPAEQIADGGMIPLDVIVAVTTDNSTTIASRDSQLALDESSDVVGELSRVAVMELIEGEAEPGAPQAADRVILVASNDTSDPLEVVQAMTRRAGVAIAMAAPASPAYLAKIAGAAVDAASRAMASIVGSNLAAEATAGASPSDDARSEAFSQLGADEDDELAADDAGSVHWNNWLAAAPLVVALACELAIASRKNRRQLDSLRPPLRAK